MEIVAIGVSEKKRGISSGYKRQSPKKTKIEEEVSRIHYDTEVKNAELDLDAFISNKNPDIVFGDKLTLYAWAENEYRSFLKSLVYNNPCHVCTDECKVKPLKIIVYRKTSGSGLSYHMCLPDYCKHIDRSHCKDTAPHRITCDTKPCPHACRYSVHDTLELKDAFVCQLTGNMHVCGDYCSLPAVFYRRDGIYTCPLTHISRGKTLVHECENMGNNFLGGLGSGSNPSLIMDIKVEEDGMVSSNTLSTKRKAIHTLSRQLAMSEHDRAKIIAINKAVCAEICNKVFFSLERQMLEIQTTIHEYSKYVDSFMLDTRPRKAAVRKGIVSERVVLSSIVSKYDFSLDFTPYFKWVPMMDQVLQHLSDKIKAIDSLALATPRDSDSVSLNGKSPSTIQNMMQRICPDAVRPPCPFSSPEFYKIRKTITSGICEACVSVWEKLVKYDYAVPEKMRSYDISKFETFALPFLYMAKKSMTISNNEYGESAVEFIPHISICDILPIDQNLQKLNLSSKKNSSTQVSVQNYIHHIKQEVDVHDL